MIHRLGRRCLTSQMLQNYTEMSRNHMTPEIKLALVTPNCEAYRKRPEEFPFSDPYWAFYWPGGQTLTRFLLGKCLTKIFVALNNDFIFRHFFNLDERIFQIFMFTTLRFLTRIYIFEQTLNFWTKLEFLTKSSIFQQKIDFWPKLRFLAKTSIFDQNFDFWPKFQFLTKTSIFDLNFNFWPKFPFLNKTSILDQNFDFWPKFQFLTKHSWLFFQTFIKMVEAEILVKLWTSGAVVAQHQSQPFYQIEQLR